MSKEEITIESVEELLFHLENLSLRAPEYNLEALLERSHNPCVFDRESPRPGGAHCLVTAYFDSVPISVTDLPLTKEEYETAKDAAFENLVTKYPSACEHAGLIVRKARFADQMVADGCDEIDLIKFEGEVDKEILQAVKQKHPGLYKDGIDGDWSRYVSWTRSFRRSLS